MGVAGEAAPGQRADQLGEFAVALPGGREFTREGAILDVQVDDMIRLHFEPLRERLGSAGHVIGGIEYELETGRIDRFGQVLAVQPVLAVDPGFVLVQEQNALLFRAHRHFLQAVDHVRQVLFGRVYLGKIKGKNSITGVLEIMGHADGPLVALPLLLPGIGDEHLAERRADLRHPHAVAAQKVLGFFLLFRIEIQDIRAPQIA